MSQVQELNAAAVQNVLTRQGQDQSATKSYPFTVKIYERFGMAFIAWTLDPGYAIGPNDVVQLREDTTWKGNSDVIKQPNGVWNTGHVFGTGLNASYWSLDFSQDPPKWRELVVTPNT